MDISFLQLPSHMKSDDMMRMAAFSGQQQQQRDTWIRLPSILIQFSSRGLS